MSDETLDPAAFAALIKDKHPEYKNVPDEELTARVLAKYPDYQSRVFQPGEEKANPNKSARVTGPPPAPSGVAGLAQGIKEDYVPKTYKSGDFLAGLKHEVAHPIDSASLLLGGAQQGSQDQFEKMFQAQSPVEAAGHGLAGLLPGIGPGAAQAGENIGKGNYAEGIGNAVGILAPFGVKPALGAVKGAIPDLVSGAKNLVGTGAAEGLGDAALAGKTSPTATGAAAISHAQQMFNAAKVAGGAKFKALGPLTVDLSDVADQLDSIGQLPAKASAARAAMNQAAATVKKSLPGFVPSKESLSFFPDYKQANIDYQQALTEVPFNEAQELVSDLGRRSKIIRGGPPPDPAVMKAYKGVDDAIGRSADRLDENGRAAYQDAKDFWKKNVADVYYRGHGDDLLSLAKDPHKVTSVIGPHDVEAVKGIRQALIPDWADPAAKAQGQKVWNNVRQAWASDKLLGAPEAGDTVDLSSLKGNRQGVGSSVLNEMFRDPQGQNWLNNFNKVAETFGDKGAAKLLPNAAKYLNVKKAVAQSLLNSDKMTNTITQQPDLLGQIPNPPPEAPASAAPPVPPSFLGNDPEDFKNGYDPRSESTDAPSGNRRNTPGDATSAQTRGPQSAAAPQGPGPGAPPQPPPQPQGNAPAQAGVGGQGGPPQPINPTGPVPLPVPPGAVPPGLPPGVPPQGVQPPPVPMMPPPAGPPGSMIKKRPPAADIQGEGPMLPDWLQQLSGAVGNAAPGLAKAYGNAATNALPAVGATVGAELGPPGMAVGGAGGSFLQQLIKAATGQPTPSTPAGVTGQAGGEGLLQGLFGAVTPGTMGGLKGMMTRSEAEPLLDAFENFTPLRQKLGLPSFMKPKAGQDALWQSRGIHPDQNLPVKFSVTAMPKEEYAKADADKTGQYQPLEKLIDYIESPHYSLAEKALDKGIKEGKYPKGAQLLETPAHKYNRTIDIDASPAAPKQLPPGSYLGQGQATPGASLKKAPPADVKFSPKAKIQAMYKALPGAPQHVEVGAYTDPKSGLIHIPEGTAPEKVPGLIAHERAHKEYRGNPALQQQGQQILEAVTRGYPGPLPETVAHLQKYMGLKEYDQPALAEEAYAAQKGFMAGGPPQAGTGAPPAPPQGFLTSPPPANMSDLLDLPGYLRYGMPTSGKEAVAAGGGLPGAPYDPSANQDVGNRYAAGYLFGKQWPNFSQYAMPVVNFIHGLAGDSSNLQSYANQGVNNGRAAGKAASSSSEWHKQEQHLSHRSLHGAMPEHLD